MHRPSGWSRSYVLASLRALHLDQHLRPGALRTKSALTPAARTGNAGSMSLAHPPIIPALWLSPIRALPAKCALVCVTTLVYDSVTLPWLLRSQATVSSSRPFRTVVISYSGAVLG